MDLSGVIARVEVRVTEPVARRLRALAPAAMRRVLETLNQLADPTTRSLNGLRNKRYRGRDLWEVRVDENARVLYEKRVEAKTGRGVFVVHDFGSHDPTLRRGRRVDLAVGPPENLACLDFTAFDAVGDDGSPDEGNAPAEIARWELLPNVDDLLRQIHGQVLIDLDRLTDEQKMLADPDYAGPILIDGVPGSGKTTIALYRALRAKHAAPTRRILYCTLSPALLATMRFILGHLSLNFGVPADGVVVRHFSELCEELLQAVSPAGKAQPRVLSREESIGLLADILQYGAKSCALSASQIYDEIIKWIFRPVDLHAEAQLFLDLPRYVRRAVERGLSADDARSCFVVFEEYARRIAHDDVLDELTVTSRLFEVARTGGFEDRLLWDDVFLDEAQDLTEGQWAIAWSLCRDARNLFLACDEAQQLTPSGFDLGQALNLWNHTDFLRRRSGRVERIDEYRLLTSYRNPGSIVTLVAAYDRLKRAAPGLERSGGKILEPVVSHDGMVPVHIVADDVFGCLVRLLAASNRSMIKVVAADPEPLRRQLAELVRRHPLAPLFLPRSESGDLPIVSPFEAKGSEAEVVVLVEPFSFRGERPTRYDWNAWYVGITRCCERLILLDRVQRASPKFVDLAALPIAPETVCYSDAASLRAAADRLGLRLDDLTLVDLALGSANDDRVIDLVSGQQDEWRPVHVRLLLRRTASLVEWCERKIVSAAFLANDPYRAEKLAEVFQYLLHEEHARAAEGLAERTASAGVLADTVRRMMATKREDFDDLEKRWINRQLGASRSTYWRLLLAARRQLEALQKRFVPIERSVRRSERIRETRRAQRTKTSGPEGRGERTVATSTPMDTESLARAAKIETTDLLRRIDDPHVGRLRDVLRMNLGAFPEETRQLGELAASLKELQREYTQILEDIAELEASQ